LKRPSLGIAVVYNPGVEERRRFVPAPPIFFQPGKEQRRHEQAQARSDHQASRKEEEAEGEAGRGKIVFPAFPAV
jgi:hypothetical protein